jgi:predicted nucleotidyltransferase
MASFAKPISRATAERLLVGLLDRAAAWNAKPDKLVSIDEVLVFGSYLDPTIDRLGDVDIAVTLSNWPEHQPHEIFNKRLRA